MTPEELQAIRERAEQWIGQARADIETLLDYINELQKQVLGLMHDLSEIVDEDDP